MSKWIIIPLPSLRKIKQAFSVIFILGFLFAPKFGIYNIISSWSSYNSSLLEAEIDSEMKAKMFSPYNGDYRLKNPEKSDFSRGQSKIIDNLLGGKENGFFLDIGAGDGETNSVSLYLEREKKWLGVLVEANETNHRLSIAKNRKSLLWNLRIRLDTEKDSHSGSGVTPDRLFQMINRTSIDLLSINLNGLELQLISHIDFAQYHIRVITIELQNDGDRQIYAEITKVLLRQGYMAAHHVVTGYLGKKDVIYMKEWR